MKIFIESDIAIKNNRPSTTCNVALIKTYSTHAPIFDVRNQPGERKQNPNFCVAF
jgi:hypothetical protein